MKPHRLRLQLIAFLLLLGSVMAVLEAGTVQAQVRKVRMAALVSQPARQYEEAVKGFREQLSKAGIQAEVESIQLDGDAAKASLAAEKLKKEGVDLVLALGSVAALAVANKLGDIPVVAGMVVDFSELAGKGNITGVTLEIPPEVVLQSACRALPGLKKVGFLYGSGKGRARLESAESATRSSGLSLQAEKVDKATDLPMVLEKLAKGVDMLWGMHDDTVYSPQTAKQILLFCFQNRIPFVGLSEAWVKAGAILSVDADYREIGVQCAEMAGSFLKGQKSSTIPVARPRKHTYSVNLRTAEHMKIDIPSAVLQGAAEVHR